MTEELRCPSCGNIIMVSPIALVHYQEGFMLECPNCLQTIEGSIRVIYMGIYGVDKPRQKE